MFISFIGIPLSISLLISGGQIIVHHVYDLMIAIKSFFKSDYKVLESTEVSKCFFISSIDWFKRVLCYCYIIFSVKDGWFDVWGVNLLYLYHIVFQLVSSSSESVKYVSDNWSHGTSIGFTIFIFIICAREAKADIGLPVADDDYDDDYDDDDYDPGIKCTKLA